MMTDIMADSLTRIRNAAQRRLDVTTLLHSKMVEATVAILVEKGYLESYTVKEDGNKKTIDVVLKYGDNEKSVINEIKKISKPGRRIHRGKDEIKTFKNGYGTLVVSTSQGVLANDEAYKRGIGGEVICSIW
ncbi:30S ribosomal protein S8 [Sulfurovum sp.]|jgi:small subunit ribosomal protein S8|uniref:30S ribosomal protein S8 n=1 Tax=Sulfurovum sp. TaxID=1969726 RepID=UPI002A35C6B9|nr:30S ribosomal protein S8 [Sulfurovum sp.]MDD2450372.1 30S ribosomal protein S8 [Sulfurovum sp.]MDD3498814.1 30S ribosomal protein S8 [Sulfurovum sp.]MDY0403277.1 30S ribosomal protein S8 [Sulfurovum sp.]